MAVPLTALEPVEFTPPSLPDELKGPADNDPVLHRVRLKIRVPTPMERDSYASAMLRHGVIHYTRQQIRDLSLAGVQELFPTDEHEEKQALLRELWELNDDKEHIRQLEFEILREEQEKAKAGKRDIDIKAVTRRCKEIVPDVVMDHARQIDGTALSQQIVARFKPLNEAVAALADQDAKRAWMNARMYVIGWTGLEHEPDPPPISSGLKQNELDYLRRQIGEKAFLELSDFITAMQGIDGDEEKNLASLLADMSAPIGSTQSTSAESSENGNSTAGPSTTTQESESPKMTEPSSSSTTSSSTATGASRRGRTGGRSSTNRSS